MEANVGTLDSAVRVAGGAVAGAVSLAMLAGVVPGSSLASLALGGVAGVLLSTGLLETCGLYAALGVDTR